MRLGTVFATNFGDVLGFLDAVTSKTPETPSAPLGALPANYWGMMPGTRYWVDEKGAAQNPSTARGELRGNVYYPYSAFWAEDQIVVAKGYPVSTRHATAEETQRELQKEPAEPTRTFWTHMRYCEHCRVNPDNPCSVGVVLKAKTPTFDKNDWK